MMTDIDLIPCLAVRGNDEPEAPTFKFHPTAPQLCVVYKSISLAASKVKQLSASWVVLDVGDAAKPGTTIATTHRDLGSNASKPDWWSGSFTLSKPNKGWPVGRYRVYIRADTELIKSVDIEVSKDGLGQTEEPVLRIKDMEAIACLGIDRSSPAFDAPLEPTEAFEKTVDAVFVVWRSRELAASHARGEATDVVGAWVAVDAGPAAPPGTVIATIGKDLTELAGSRPEPGPGEAVWYSGNFNLSRPTNGWPVGSYRMDVYVDFKDGVQEKVESVEFSIL
jgi:hypothetical protein